MDTKKEHFFVQHLEDLADRAGHSGYPCFTEFLTTGELSVLLQRRKQFYGVRVETWGGHEDCDHRMAGFFPEDYEGDVHAAFPIRCLCVKAKNIKYAKELTHRDYLGAILNLGIERSTIGDIRIFDQTAYVFASEDLAAFILQSLDRIGRTSVTCVLVEDVAEIPKQQFEVRQQSVASLRLDNVVSAMIGSSRGKASELIAQGRVVAGDEQRDSNSFRCVNDSVFSIRGYGKFRLLYDEGNCTKKGKQKITVYKYI